MSPRWLTVAVGCGGHLAYTVFCQHNRITQRSWQNNINIIQRRDGGSLLVYHKAENRLKYIRYTRSALDDIRKTVVSTQVIFPARSEPDSLETRMLDMRWTSVNPYVSHRKTGMIYLNSVLVKTFSTLFKDNSARSRQCRNIKPVLERWEKLFSRLHFIYDILLYHTRGQFSSSSIS